MRFSWQEYWCRLLSAPPGPCPNLGLEPTSSASSADSLLPSYQGSPSELIMIRKKKKKTPWDYFSCWGEIKYRYCKYKLGFPPSIWKYILIYIHLTNFFHSHYSVQFSCSGMSNSMKPHRLQHARPRHPSSTPRVYPNSCALSRWCHPTSVIPFSSHLRSFPASGSFQMSQLFASGGQSIGVSASTSVLPMNTQDWFPLRWTGWISLQSKGLSSVFSNTTVQKHQFFDTQLSL